MNIIKQLFPTESASCTCTKYIHSLVLVGTPEAMNIIKQPLMDLPRENLKTSKSTSLYKLGPPQEVEIGKSCNDVMITSSQLHNRDWPWGIPNRTIIEHRVP
jgi:hypothetical protein